MQSTVRYLTQEERKNTEVEIEIRKGNIFGHWVYSFPEDSVLNPIIEIKSKVTDKQSRLGCRRLRRYVEAQCFIKLISKRHANAN